MTNRRALRYKQKLDNLFVLAKETYDILLRETPSADPEVLGNWAKYLCVLTSGFIEEAVRSILSNYAKDKSSPQVNRFVTLRLERGCQNLNMENILQVVGAFSLDWRAELKKETEGELKDAVDSVVANKNNIVHGRSSNISYNRVKEYYDKVVKVINLIEIRCSI